MGKGRRNQRNVDYYKVQGGAVEDRDVSRASKQKLATQKRPTRAKKPAPADVHPAQPRKIAAPKPPRAAQKSRPKAPSRPAPTPRPVPPSRPPRAPARVGAAPARGITQRVVRAAELAISALRWAGHQIQVVRGKATKEIS